MDKLIMSKKEREQLIVFKQLKARQITQKVAAQLLDISVRWVRKKLTAFYSRETSSKSIMPNLLFRLLKREMLIVQFRIMICISSFALSKSAL